MFILMLTSLAIGSAILCIRAKYRGPKIHIYLFKPLTTIIIFAIALYVGSDNQSLYKYFIASGLIFCLFGDIFLILPSKKFIYGLTSFLFAHLLFSIAFASSFKIVVTWWLMAGFTFIAIILAKILLPSVEKIKIPIIVYILIISLMAWLSWERFKILNDTFSLLAAVGTLFFLVSDSALALNKFKKKFKRAELIILSTYYLSIWLIALSVSTKIILF
jgi:uncharacterized membrane protein YhhN